MLCTFSMAIVLVNIWSFFITVATNPSHIVFLKIAIRQCPHLTYRKKSITNMTLDQQIFLQLILKDFNLQVPQTCLTVSCLQ